MLLHCHSNVAVHEGALSNSHVDDALCLRSVEAATHWRLHVGGVVGGVVVAARSHTWTHTRYLWIHQLSLTYIHVIFVLVLLELGLVLEFLLQLDVLGVLVHHVVVNALVH